MSFLRKKISARDMELIGAVEAAAKIENPRQRAAALDRIYDGLRDVNVDGFFRKGLPATLLGSSGLLLIGLLLTPHGVLAGPGLWIAMTGGGGQCASIIGARFLDNLSPRAIMRIEVGLHFEDGPASTLAYLNILDGRIVELKDVLGHQAELERWTQSWGRVYELHPLEPLTPAVTNRIGERLALYISTLWPIVRAANVRHEREG